MPGSYRWVNREGVIQNMTARYGFDKETQKLLDNLSTKELQILVKYKDLLDKINLITQLDLSTITEMLERQYEIDFEVYDRSIWASPRESLKTPTWMRTSHVGWYLEDKDQLLEWCRRFLLREVRINLWMRYIRYKETVPPMDMLGMYV